MFRRNGKRHLLDSRRRQHKDDAVRGNALVPCPRDYAPVANLYDGSGHVVCWLHNGGNDLKKTFVSRLTRPYD